MKRRFGAVLAAALVACGVCGARADDIATLPLGDPSRAYLMGSGEAGAIIRCAGEGSPASVTLEQLAAELAGVDVVIVGENHTNLGGHRTQWGIVDALAKSGRAIALGMEFFELTDDEALAAYVKGADDLPRMLDRTGWYAGGNYNFEYYRPMIDACKSHGAPVYGLNVPREWVRAVSRGGVDSLTPEQRAAVGELGPVSERHKYLVNQMMSGLGAAMPQMFEGMYRGQTTWDSAMATSILRAHKWHVTSGTPRTIVVIVGSGHMAHGLGIPARLKELDPSLKVRTIAPVQGTLPDEDARLHPGFERKETAVFSLGYGDYAYILPDEGGAEAYPQVGVRVAAPAGGAGLKIAGVTPGGIADRSGLKKDDEVLKIGSAAPTTQAEAGFVLGSLRWGERVEWRVRRAGAEIAVAMLVVATTDREEDWLKSEAASQVLDSFDPTSDRAYMKGAESPRGVSARLVTFRKKASRIDVVREGVPVETWELDGAGRPVLGLYAAPTGDGAVRVEITRDAAGKATKVRRLSADGKELAAAPDPHADVSK
jgi:uncharacterized iron-regulated protein